MKITLSPQEILQACAMWADTYKQITLHNPRFVHEVDHDGRVTDTRLEADMEPPQQAPTPPNKGRK